MCWLGSGGTLRDMELFSLGYGRLQILRKEA
jgi:hypothetical protein